MTGTPHSSTPAHRVLTLLSEDTDIGEAEAADVRELLTAADRYADARGIPMNDVRRLALAAHGLAFVRRVHAHEYPPVLDRGLYEEVGDEQFAGVRALLTAFCADRGHTVTDPEVLLLTLHFEAALQEGSSPPGHRV
ncbi:hypothetical protein C5F59_004830 [Streptomyces sp. QL37]|uniref:hypothetical protein n=1 Tax=Streptomyces sp. QL37 TaxID=2093747 RepID=UPI000CF1F88F|nr:hypothetical protein [Streptomyces sp. QL37]PPQ56097.1 hypothetical protein C5F59_04880 [Streptomyces sp. QL37]